VECRSVEGKQVDRDSAGFSLHNSRESSRDLLTVRGKCESPDALLLTLNSRTQSSRSEFPDLGCLIHPLSDQGFIGLASSKFDKTGLYVCARRHIGVLTIDRVRV